MSMRRRLRGQLSLRKKAPSIVFIAIIVVVLVLLLWVIQYLPVLYQLLLNKEIELKKSDGDQRVNVVLLGIGGGQHEGPLLTDTIIFASLDPKTNKATLVSIPRDMWVPELSAKINTAYASGESKQKGGGLVLTKAVVERILGQEVDYGLRVDFNGFIRAVDMVGGLDITVDRALDDPEYPISGKETDDCGYKDEEFVKRATASSQLEAFPCRYEQLHFDAGGQQMDGTSALKFVRSRHATGSEGTDFARSKRQEKIISAFREKIFSVGTFLNPIKVISLYDIFKDSIDTDIIQNEYDDFIKLARKMEKSQLKSVVLDIGSEQEKRNGLLINPPVTKDFRGQWVIIPKAGNGNYTQIQSFVDCEIKVGNCSVTPTRSPQ